MSRRALLVLLVTAQTATLIAGWRAVATAQEPPAPARVAASVASAPQPLAVTTKPAPVRKPAARVEPKPRKAAAAPTRRATTRRTTVAPARSARAPLTGRLLVLATAARIPGYQPGSVTWVVTTRHGSWGLADWYRNTIYISPKVPANRLYDVVAHEWSHLVSVRPYASVEAAVKEMNRVFGGSGLTGAERAADCMARRLGAQWTHYTSCGSGEWRTAAARLLAGHAA